MTKLISLSCFIALIAIVLIITLLIVNIHKKKSKPDVKKIYKTTDGYLSGSHRVKKPRRIAVIDQRKDDKALAVVKIYSKKDRLGNAYIKKLVLKPDKHSSLTEDSLVGSSVIIASKNGEDFKPINTRDLTQTNDKLTDKELSKIKKGLGGNRKNYKANKNKIKKWKNHFKK